MNKLITPIILLIVSGVVFVVLINPGYARIKDIKVEGDQYGEALEKSRQLQETRDFLLSQYNNFSTNDLDDLKKMVPDHVDNVRLIIEIDSIASKYGMVVRDASLVGVKSEEGGIIVEQGRRKEEIVLNFSVVSSYDSFIKFIKDLEKSLRIVDIESIKFLSSDVDSNEYDVSIKTYWLSSDQ